MEPSWSSRCYNPLNFKLHKIVVGLRRTSTALQEKWSSPSNSKLCTSCRKQLANRDPPVDNENSPLIGENIIDDIVVSEPEENRDNTVQHSSPENADQNLVESASSIYFSQLTSSQSRLSELSIGTRLPIINEGLILLDSSPIPRKKLKAEQWVDKKVDKGAANLKKALGASNEPDFNTQRDARDLHHIINNLKEKFHNAETSKSEKVQLLTILPLHWSTKKVCQTMDAEKYMVNKAKKLCDKNGILSMPNAKLGHKIPKETESVVIAFYNDDRVSVNLPGKKDYVSTRNANNEKVHVQKRLILSNLKELFEFFRSEHQEVKIGFSSFAAMRPKHCVLAGAGGTHTVCVCSIHENLKLMMIGSNLRVLTKDSVHHLENYKDCLNSVICESPSQDCYFGSCANCPGTGVLHAYLSEVLEENDIESVTYKNWVSRPRTTLETIIQSSSEFIDRFCESVTNLLPHAFVAQQQGNYIKQTLNNLENGEFLVVCDFAENYAFVVQNAAPGFHWNNNQATVYPVVIYFKMGDKVDHKSLVVLSDCTAHDSIAVHVYSKIIIDFIKSINDNPSKIYYFSDGAPQQFKNLKNFVNLYYHKSDHGITAEWHFFGTAHGKGPSDGLGGTVKRMASRVSLQLPPDQQITTPQELFAWASQPNKFPNITLRYSSQSEYDNAKDFLTKGRFKNAKRIPGTQKLHCIIPEEDGFVRVKPVSSSEKSQSFKILK